MMLISGTRWFHHAHGATHAWSMSLSNQMNFWGRSDPNLHASTNKKHRDMGLEQCELEAICSRGEVMLKISWLKLMLMAKWVWLGNIMGQVIVSHVHNLSSTCLIELIQIPTWFIFQLCIYIIDLFFPLFWLLNPTCPMTIDMLYLAVDTVKRTQKNWINEGVGQLLH